VELQAPRVNDRRRDEEGHRQRFTSHLLPPYDFRPALEGLLGEDAAGLSPTNIARLTALSDSLRRVITRRID
jgi:hypothetical protein